MASCPTARVSCAWTSDAWRVSSSPCRSVRFSRSLSRSASWFAASRRELGQLPGEVRHVFFGGGALVTPCAPSPQGLVPPAPSRRPDADPLIVQSGPPSLPAVGGARPPRARGRRSPYGHLADPHFPFGEDGAQGARLALDPGGGRTSTVWSSIRRGPSAGLRRTPRLAARRGSFSMASRSSSACRSAMAAASTRLLRGDFFGDDRQGFPEGRRGRPR